MTLGKARSCSSMEDINGYVKELDSRLSALIDPLETTIRRVEPNFLELGKELQKVNSNAEELTRLSVDTAQSVGDESEQNALANIGGFAQQSLEMLETCQSEVTGSLNSVSSVIEHLERLQKLCPVIKTIAKTLNIVALNIAMESSRTEKGEEMFSFFVNEIKELSIRVNEISRGIREDSGNAKLKQMEIYGEVIERKELLSEIAEVAHNMVKENIAGIEHLLDISARALEEAGERSQKISKHIGEIVVAIQFHDITRQQLEHVIDAIKDIKDQYNSDLSTSGKDALKSEMLSKAYSILNVQAAQIKQVIEEIQGAYQNIAQSFSMIGKEIDELISRTTDIWSRSSNLGEKKNPFEALMSGFTKLGRILDQGYGLAKKIEEAMLSSSETASRLFTLIGKVEDISSDLHIKAINAIIMSNKMGQDGKTHAILAQDVTEISKESNEFAIKVVDVINSISELANELSCLSSDKEVKIEGENKEQHAGMNAGIERISNAYRKFQEDASMTFEHSNSLKEMISKTENRLSFLNDLVIELSDYLNLLEEALQTLTPFKQDIDQKEDSVEDIARYTMKVERDIHTTVINDNAMPQEITRQNESGATNLGDNVELF
jgi:methyl-accepting chemotaxis protein